MYLVKGNTAEWELVIGLEIHAQVISNSKLFSGASTSFGSMPNENVSMVDAAMPGMLPVLNRFCVEQAVKTGLGINGVVNKYSVFDRKNYFYADLPQGYQISQFYYPIVTGGFIDIDTENGPKRIGVTRIHLEQDAGKSIHDQSPTSSFIDLNRCGIALMEIVSEPDMRSPEEAGEYLKEVRSLVRYLETSDGDLEKGSFRCDANVSVRKKGVGEFGTRCEIKNLNSIRNVVRAIEFEARRQVELLESGEKVEQETRLFDAGTGATRTMRSKENAHDYRYFPDPDLLPVILEDDYIAKIKLSLPELPQEKKKRYVEELSLSNYDASVLTAEKEVAAFFEEIAAKVNPKLAANWITAELFGRLNKAGLEISQSKITSNLLIKLIELLEKNIISGKIAKDIFDEMFESGKDPVDIVAERGLTQVTNEEEILGFIKKTLLDNQDKVAEYKSGKEALFGFFVGQVMKISGGRANPSLVNTILKEKLK